MRGQGGERDAGFPEAGPVAGLCPERHVRGLASAGGRRPRSASCRTAATRSTRRSRRPWCSASPSRRRAASAATPSCSLKPAGRGAAGRAERLGAGAGGARRRGAAIRRARGDAGAFGGGGDGAGRGRRLRAARGRLGPARPRRVPRAGDRPCRGRRAGGAAHGAGLAAGRAEPARRGARPLPPRRRGPGAGAGVPRAGPGRGAAPDRPRRAATGSTPARWPRTWSPRSRALGGTHTLDDFAATACAYVEPISGSYRGHELVELPPNGQGATAILMAKILAHFDLDALDPLGAARAHLEAEAAKLAYDARNRFIADPDSAPLRVGHMIADATAERLAGLIDPGRVLAEPGGGERGDPPRHRLSLRRRPRPDGGVDDLLDLSRLRLGARLDPLRDQLPEPRRRLHADARPSERGGRRQAAAAYDHPGDAAPRRAGRHAVRGDAGRLPADRPRAGDDEPARLRHGPAGGDRRAAELRLGGRPAARDRLPRRRGGGARRARPPGRPPHGAARRGAGDRDRRTACWPARATRARTAARSGTEVRQCRWPSRS